MQKASGFHRKSDASQFHILFSCWSNPSFTLPAFPVLPVSVQFALRQLLFATMSSDELKKQVTIKEIYLS